MESQTGQSCWRITAWTLLVAGAVLALVYLFGGFEASIAVAG